MGLYRRGRIWWVRVAHEGKMVRESLGTEDRDEAEFLLKLLWGREANPQAAAVRQALQRRATDGASPSAPRTVAQAVDLWLRSKVEVDHRDKPETISTYRAQALRWRRRWGHLALERLDRAELAAWRQQRLEEVAKRTVLGERAVLRSFLAWCVREELIEEVPRLDPIRGVPKRRKRPPNLEEADLATLIRTAREHPRPQVRALEPALLLGAHAGLRRAEICNVEWGDVDLGESLLVVQPHGRFSPKSHESREIPIGPKLSSYLEQLRGLRPDGRWICENAERGQWVVNLLSRWARSLWKAAGLYEVGQPTFHALRHSYASWLVADGVDIETIRTLLGHSSVQTTELYFSTTLKRKRAAVESM